MIYLICLTPRLRKIGPQPIGVAELDKVKPGLAEEAMAAGRKVELIHLTRPSGETIAKVDMTALEEIVGHPFLGITRHALQRVLLGHLPDGGIQLASRLEGLETHEAEGFSELRFEGRSEVVRACAVVGADGRRCDDGLLLKGHHDKLHVITCTRYHCVQVRVLAAVVWRQSNGCVMDAMYDSQEITRSYPGFYINSNKSSVLYDLRRTGILVYLVCIGIPGIWVCANIRVKAYITCSGPGTPDSSWYLDVMVQTL